MKNKDLLRWIAAASIALTIGLTGCKKDEKPIKIAVSYESGFNTMRKLFINQHQVSPNKVHIVEVGDVINVRNAMHTGGIIGATLSVNGTIVKSQTCECEINYTYIVQ